MSRESEIMAQLMRRSVDQRWPLRQLPHRSLGLCGGIEGMRPVSALAMAAVSLMLIRASIIQVTQLL